MRKLLIIAAAAALAFASSLASAQATTSKWVYFDTSHKLVYLDTAGNTSHAADVPVADRIMDFSTAGYNGGGYAIPTYTGGNNIRRVGPPTGNPETDYLNIKEQIDLATNDTATCRTYHLGNCLTFVQLQSGTYQLSRPIYLNGSDIVLAGAGSSEATGTTLRWVNLEAKNDFVVYIGPPADPTPSVSNTVQITTNTPSGSSQVTVANVSGFNVGDQVVITRPVDANWIAEVGMQPANLDLKVWLLPDTDPKSKPFLTIRTITAISGNNITLSSPVTDSINQDTKKATLSKYSLARNQNVGIRDLRIHAFQPTTDTYRAIDIRDTLDAFVQNVVAHDTLYSFAVEPTAQRVTLDHVINETATIPNHPYPIDFNIAGTQVLVNRCQSNTQGGSWPLSTDRQVTGPIVVLNFKATGSTNTKDNLGIEPHMRWATGILVDNALMLGTSFSHPGVGFQNRAVSGDEGSAQGWAQAFSVIWVAKHFTSVPYVYIYSAYHGPNWCIYCSAHNKDDPNSTDMKFTGKAENIDVTDFHDIDIDPKSLYLAQLNERFGAQGLKALGNMGYLSTDPASKYGACGPGCTM